MSRSLGLVTFVTLLGASAGCSLHLLAGADRTSQPDGKGYGWHLGFGAGLTYDPRQKGAIAVAASRRADHPGTSIESYRTDGWEARGQLDLPWPAWRLSAAGRVASAEQVYSEVPGVTGAGGSAWGASAGLTRYWPMLAQVVAVSVEPALSSWDAPMGTVWATGVEARLTWTFDGMLKVWAACDEGCRAEVARFKPKGSSTGAHSWISTKRGNAGCYYKNITDGRGNPKSVWTCP